MRTILSDRVVWYDGDISVSSNKLAEMLSSGIISDFSGVCAEREDEEVRKARAIYGDILPVKDGIDLDRIDPFQWNIPEYYKELDWKSEVYTLLLEEVKELGVTGKDIAVRMERVEKEIDLIEDSDRGSLVTLMMYIVDTLEDAGVVWGVGRGSVCSSYVMYLVGVHDVDSVQYNLAPEDFFR